MSSKVRMIFRRWLVTPLILLLLTMPLIGCKQVPIIRDVISARDVEKSAEAGDVESQYQIGMHYSNGRGVLQNYSTSAKWFKKASEGGHTGAQFMYGAALYAGQGVEQDHRGAVKWLAKAAAKGHMRAQNLLGDAYLNGRGVSKDIPWGIRWYGMAANQGHDRAKFTLGVAFAQGLGLDKNPVEAVKWLHLSQRAGLSGVEPLLDKLQQNMSGADYKRGLSAADGWKARKMSGIYNRPTMRYIQYVLGRIGYPAGYADGIEGPMTRHAVTRFLGDRQSVGSGREQLVKLLRKESVRVK
ncbi:MAG: tetratricopeptide repeat protein [Sedimenticola sp.]